MRMTVVRPGPMTVLKDGGRPGHAALGVAPSGAADRAAYARANALVGNPPGVAVLECTLGGLRVRFDAAAVVALTGTDAVLTVQGRQIPAGVAAEVPGGADVTVGVPRRGLRSYLAVRGGFDVPPVLGSRSTDHLAGVGPARPAAGDELPIGPAPGEWAGPAGSAPDGPSAGGAAPEFAAPESTAAPFPDDDPVVLEVDLGPRDDWFTGEALAALFDAEFTVTPAGNAVGLRLAGPVLTRRRTGELPSEGVVRGSVQVPPDGQPIVFQADHPVTGGYPVIAVLTPEAADRAAQIRPGRRVRFTRAPD
jgi:biotin-dependent carboxylase-like uncharacterized protein